MTMQTDNKAHGLLNNPWGQIGLLTAVVIVLTVLAAHYVWQLALEAASITPAASSVCSQWCSSSATVGSTNVPCGSLVALLDADEPFRPGEWIPSSLVGLATMQISPELVYSNELWC